MPSRPIYHRSVGARALKQAYEVRAARKEDKGFYGSARWRRLRQSVLARQPLCQRCAERGVVTAAEHVHHRLPRKTHPDRELDPTNLEALCLACHNAEEVR